MKKDTFLIVDSSENNADLYYRTGFFVPDPVIFIEHNRKRILVLSDLELDRGKKEANVDKVLSLSEYRKNLPSRKRKLSGMTDIVDLVFKELRIKRAVVPGRFPIRYADELRKLGYKISCKSKEPFFEERLTKTPQEIKFISDSLRKPEKAPFLQVNRL